MNHFISQTESLPLVRYSDVSFDFEGFGFLIQEEDDHYQFASVVSVLLAEKAGVDVQKLPTYTLLKPHSSYHTIEEKELLFSISEWMLSVPLDGLSANDIHHTGLFMETFLTKRGTLDVRLEYCLSRSLLDGQALANVVRHIWTHHRAEAGHSACAFSAPIQRALEGVGRF